MIGCIDFPFVETVRAVMSGTAASGIVTFAKAVVPMRPVAVKLIDVAELVGFESTASLRMKIEHAVPQLSGPVVEVMLYPTITEETRGPYVPVTLTA